MQMPYRVCKKCGKSIYEISGQSKGGRNVYLKRHKCAAEQEESPATVRAKAPCNKPSVPCSHEGDLIPYAAYRECSKCGTIYNS